VEEFFLNTGNMCGTLSYMIHKIVFVNQDISFANCDKLGVKHTLPSVQFDSNNKQLVSFVLELQKIGICTERKTQ
jgi:hypothetical protein